MQGIVTSFFCNASYGFIAGPDGQEHFVHITHIPIDCNGLTYLNDGDEVEFDIRPPYIASKKPQALVTKILTPRQPDTAPFPAESGKIVNIHPSKHFGFVQRRIPCSSAFIPTTTILNLGLRVGDHITYVPAPPHVDSKSRVWVATKVQRSKPAKHVPGPSDEEQFRAAFRD